jgi:membrane protein YdbS with pleckstrin-like domain
LSFSTATHTFLRHEGWREPVDVSYDKMVVRVGALVVEFNVPVFHIGDVQQFQLNRQEAERLARLILGEEA